VFHLDRNLVPPLLAVAASETLQNMIRRLVEIISAKSTLLAGLRREKDLARADWSAADIESFWRLYTVNGALPLLLHFCDHSLSSEVSAFQSCHHPEELFAQMLSLAGALTAFSPDIQPRDLPLYDHDNLGDCFSDLNAKLLRLLEGYAKTKFASLPLSLVQPFVYASAIDDEKYLIKTRFYLAVSSPIRRDELIRRVLEDVKMCSATHIGYLLGHALPGIGLTHVPPPPSIPAKLEYQYFSLEQSGPVWESVERARNIAAYLPDGIPTPKAEVIISFP
jgi:type VI secretion system protein ImpJ